MDETATATADTAILRQVIRNELSDLRQELFHLKECQLRYVVFGVTAAGAAATLVFNPPSAAGGQGTNPVVMFLPIAVILPFWCIFFDKATSITRIAGYYRVMESIITDTIDNSHHRYKYMGWETSLREWRTKEATERRKKHIHMTHYWAVVYLSFLLMSLIGFFGGIFVGICNSGSCPESGISTYLWTPWFSLPVKVVNVVILSSWVLSLFFTTRTLWSLLRGHARYSSREEAWKKLLRRSNREKDEDED